MYLIFKCAQIFLKLFKRTIFQKKNFYSIRYYTITIEYRKNDIQLYDNVIVCCTCIRTYNYYYFFFLIINATNKGVCNYIYKKKRQHKSFLIT